MKHMIHKIMLFFGWVNITVWGLIMTYWLIMQWYAPGNIVTFYFNNFGEAYLEYVMGIIAVPCTLYYLYQSILRISNDSISRGTTNR